MLCCGQKGFAFVHSIHAHIGKERGLRFDYDDTAQVGAVL